MLRTNIGDRRSRFEAFVGSWQSQSENIFTIVPDFGPRMVSELGSQEDLSSNKRGMPCANGGPA